MLADVPMPPIVVIEFVVTASISFFSNEKIGAVLRTIISGGAEELERVTRRESPTDEPINKWEELNVVTVDAPVYEMGSLDLRSVKPFLGVKLYTSPNEDEMKD